MNTAIRFFINNASTYGIDPEHIYAGSVSAGAIMGLAAAFMDSADVAAMPRAHRQAVNSVSGGLLGTQHEGYRPHMAGVINLSGAIYHNPNTENNILQNNDDGRYIYTLHSLNDPVIPFFCGHFFLNNNQITQTYQLCGGGYINNYLWDHNNFNLTDPSFIPYLDFQPVIDGLDARLHIEYYAPPVISHPGHPIFNTTREIIDNVVAGIYNHFISNKTFTQDITGIWQRYGNVKTFPAVSMPNIVMLEDGQVGKTAIISKESAHQANEVNSSGVEVNITVGYKHCTADRFVDNSRGLALILGAVKEDYDNDTTLSGSNVANLGVKKTAGVYVVIKQNRIFLRLYDGTLLKSTAIVDDNCSDGPARIYTLQSTIPANPLSNNLPYKASIKLDVMDNGTSTRLISYRFTDASLADQIANGHVGVSTGNSDDSSAQHVISDISFYFDSFDE